MTDESQIGTSKTPEERLASLPKFLREISEEQRTVDVDNQKQWAKSVASPFAQGSAAEIARARAVRLEADWRASIAAIQTESALQSPDQQRTGELNNAYRNAARQLAEALALQGKFEEAAEWVRGIDPGLRAECLAMLRAIEKDDDSRCGSECAAKHEADPTTITQEHIVAEVFSQKHNAPVSVFRCNSCGSLNARPMAKSDLRHARRREARRQARELTTGMSPTRAAEELRRAGLTTEKVYA